MGSHTELYPGMEDFIETTVNPKNLTVNRFPRNTKRKSIPRRMVSRIRKTL